MPCRACQKAKRAIKTLAIIKKHHRIIIPTSSESNNKDSSIHITIHKSKTKKPKTKPHKKSKTHKKSKSKNQKKSHKPKNKRTKN